MLTYSNITEEQRLHKAVVKLMSEEALTSLCGVIMVGKREVVDSIPTACTDGVNEKYGRKFIGSLSDPQLRAVILHELGHKMYMHLTTWEHLWRIDPDRANRAADRVVNLWVYDLINKDSVNAEFWTSPPPLLDEKYRGMSVQQVFDDLGKQGQGQDQDQGQPEPSMDEHDHESAQSMSEAQKQQVKQTIDSALRQGAMMADKLGSGGDRALGDLLQSKIDWRQVLREFITNLCVGSDYATWASPNRRFIGEGYYMPSGVSEQVGEVIVAPDMSMSMWDQLPRIMGEIKGICEQVKPSQIRILYWDTQVCADEVYDFAQLDQIMSLTKPAGGGGTDAACIPAYIATKGYTPQAVIVLTDGYVCSWGSWVHPVLWCVTGSKVRPPMGKVVYVD